jgi:hypothetical protein
MLGYQDRRSGFDVVAFLWEKKLWDDMDALL